MRAWLRDAGRWIVALPGLGPAVCGIAGGVAMALYFGVALSIAGRPPLAALRAIGAGHPVGGALLAGILMHFVTAAFWGLRLGELLRYAPARFSSSGAALVLGLLWGLALWLVMGLLIGPLFSPSVARTDPLHYLLAHLVYGLTSTWALARWLRADRR